MTNRVAIALLISVVMVSSLVLAAPKERQSTDQFKSLMQRLYDAWSALDPDKTSPFYAKDADLDFYDIAPMKYTGWAEYAEGVR